MNKILINAENCKKWKIENVSYNVLDFSTVIFDENNDLVKLSFKNIDDLSEFYKNFNNKTEKKSENTIKTKDDFDKNNFKLGVYIHLNDIEEVKKLIDAGEVDLNTKSEDGTTILSRAILDSKFEIAELLINAGADVNLQNKYAMTPLLYAIRDNKFEIAEKLIKAGADVNMENKHGTTVLKYAIEYNRIEIVEMLKKYGAKE